MRDEWPKGIEPTRPEANGALRRLTRRKNVVDRTKRKTDFENEQDDEFSDYGIRAIAAKKIEDGREDN